VAFIIDGQRGWVEQKAPYFYGTDGNWLVTTFLTPGESDDEPRGDDRFEQEKQLDALFRERERRQRQREEVSSRAAEERSEREGQIAREILRHGAADARGHN
jgi:hypothetical protein